MYKDVPLLQHMCSSLPKVYITATIFFKMSEKKLQANPVLLFTWVYLVSSNLTTLALGNCWSISMPGYTSPPFNTHIFNFSAGVTSRFPENLSADFFSLCRTRGFSLHILAPFLTKHYLRMQYVYLQEQTDTLLVTLELVQSCGSGSFNTALNHKHLYNQIIENFHENGFHFNEQSITCLAVTNLAILHEFGIIQISLFRFRSRSAPHVTVPVPVGYMKIGH